MDAARVINTEINNSETIPNTSSVFTIVPVEQPQTEAELEASPPVNDNDHTQLCQLPFRDKLTWFCSKYVNLQTAVRCLLILGAFYWFAVNCSSLLSQFRSHETVIYLDYQRPKVTLPPAVTVCTQNLLLHHDLANVSLADVFSGTANITANISVQCGFVGDSHKESVIINKQLDAAFCETLVPLIKSYQDGFDCVTYFSDIFGQTRRALAENVSLLMHFDRAPLIYLLISVNTNKSSNAIDPAFPLAYVAVHDSAILPDLIDIPFRGLHLGEGYGMKFVKTVQRLLPPPYQTHCYNYSRHFTTGLVNETSRILGDFPENGQIFRSDQLESYQTRGHCMLFCLWQQLNLDACANEHSVFTEEILQADTPLRCLDQAETSSNASSDCGIAFCPKTSHSYRDYAKAKVKCTAECPEACEMATFEVTTANKVALGRSWVEVDISWSIKAVTYIEHRPMLDMTSFLGTLGGEIHIWLAISVPSVLWCLIKCAQMARILPVSSIWKLCPCRLPSIDKEGG